MKRVLALVSGVVLFFSSGVSAQYKQAELPLSQLPTELDYQKKLRQFLATLTEKDFDVAQAEIKPVASDSMDDLYRLWMLTLHQLDGSTARLPASAFTLQALEANKGLVLPCPTLECQMLAWLAHWDYAGNPYKGSRALKLRAFVLAATDLMMLDHLYEHAPQGANRADFLGGNLIWMGFTYGVVKDVLPKETQTAFATGLKKMVRTIDKWGPTGAMTDMDLFAPVGLGYLVKDLDDRDIADIIVRYSQRLFTDPHYFHPAGYFVDNGCFDTSYNGISLYFGTWAALMNTTPAARDAIARAHRLRAHLNFPHPDGVFSGPSAMASRCSSDPPRDQWQFPPRMQAAGMVTDEALHLVPLPTDAVLKAAPAAVVNRLNGTLAKPRPASPQPWRETHWSGYLNFAYEHYPKGFYDRRRKLVEEKSPLLQPLYQRDETFVRDFGKAFIIARLGGFAAAIHTGPVGGIHKEWQRPYGFGGGQLSAFWTAETGPVSLARRRGVQGHIYDTFAEWRSWPVHGVTGLTVAGDLVTSTRVQQPEVEIDCQHDRGRIHVKGPLPAYQADKKLVAPTAWTYDRSFNIDAKGVRIHTMVRGNGTDKLAELYETIPLFLRETAAQKMPTIRWHTGKEWAEAATQARKVTAISIERFKGEVHIEFARPVTARLSPEVWRDGFQTQAECRTLLVDLLESGDVEYVLRPAKR